MAEVGGTAAVQADLELADGAARERIGRAEAGDSLFVEAGAGTGKTHSIIEHVMSFVGAGRSVARVAVITFTELAAGELRTRLEDRMEQLRAASAAAEDKKQAEFWEEQLAELGSASIGTIHGFCLRLLRRHSVEAGVDARAQVADEQQLSALQDRAWRRTLARLEDAAGQVAPGLPPDVLPDDPEQRLGYAGRLLGFLLADGLGEPKLRAAVERVGQLDASGFVLPPLVADTRALWLEDHVAPVLPRLEALAGRCSDPYDKLYVLLRGWIDRLEGYAGSALTLGQIAADCAGLLTADGQRLKLGNVGSTKNWGGQDTKLLRGEIGEVLVPVVKMLGPLLTHNNAVLLMQIGPVFERFFGEEKQRAGVVDFSDQLILANRLLCERPDVLEEERRRYDRIIVDECQDTDAVQARIVWMLAKRPGWQGGGAGVGGAGGAACAALEQAAVAGRLIVVGDPKQSIYRFRHADVSVYGGLGSRLGAAARVEILKNFRSQSRLIDAFNHIFAQLIGPGQRGGSGELIQAAYRPLLCGTDPGTQAHATLSADSARIEAGVPDPVAKWTEDALRSVEGRMQAEACWLASRVRALLSAGFEVWDRLAGCWRAMQLKDVAILYRATTHLSRLERAFEHEGLAYRIHAGRSFYRSELVESVRWILAAALDPLDKWAVVCAMRSALLGVSDGQILRFDNATEASMDYRSGLPELEPALEHAVGFLREAHDRASGQRGAAESRPDRLVDWILDRLDARLWATLQLRSEEILADLEKLRCLALHSAGQPGAWLGHMVASLSEQIRFERDERPGEVDPSSLNAAAFMTIHQSKGLQFPLVGLFALSSQARLQTPDVLPGPAPAGGQTQHRQIELRLTYESMSDRSALMTCGSAGAAELEAEHAAAEHTRLLYVALTRAADLLLLPMVDLHTKPERKDKEAKEQEPPTPAEIMADPRSTWSCKLGAALAVSFKGSTVPGLVRVVELAEPPELQPAGSADLRAVAALDPATAVDTAADEAAAQADRHARLQAIAGSFACLTPSRLADQELYTPVPASMAAPPAAQDWGEAMASGMAEPAQVSSPTSDDVEAAALRRELARRRGHAFHRIMERADFRAPCPGQTDAVVTSAVAEFDVPADAGLLAGWAERAWGDGVMQSARAATLAGRRVLREVPFCIPLAGDVGERFEAATGQKLVGGGVLEGVIDLLFDDGVGWQIVDYKTNRWTGPQDLDRLREHYRPQMAAYVFALGELLGGQRVGVRAEAADHPVRQPVLLFVAEGADPPEAGPGKAAAPPSGYSGSS